MLTKLLTVATGLLMLLTLCAVPAARADDGLACPYPMVGNRVKVNIAVEAGGGFCDGPTEINGTHWHCAFGGAFAGGGGIGLAPFQGVTIGGIFSGGIGGGGGECYWSCPDGTHSVQPNPPGAWKDYMVARPANNSCLEHMEAAGPTSEVVEPDQGPPGFQRPALIPPMQPDDFVPTVTNPGQGNPDGLPR